MNIIDSIGVMLGGDATPFNKMMDDADKRMEAFDKKMSAWGGRMSLYVSAPLMAMGTHNVFKFAEQEKAIMGLQAQLGKISAKPFVDFSNELQDSLGKDNDEMVKLMSRFAAMGVAAKDLKKTTVNSLGLSAATGMGEFQAFRAMQMLKQGNTALFSRYIPGLSQMSKDQQVEKVVELINRGLAKTRAELLGTAGSFRSMKLAADDAAKASGEMISKHLRLPELFRRMVGFYKNLESFMKGASETTQKWVIFILAALAAIGPVSFALAKVSTVLKSLIGAAASFGKTLIMTVLPAALLIGAAFLGWEIGKTLSSVQAGMYTIGQWTQIAIWGMQEMWEKYFESIKAGFASISAGRELAKAYGMKPDMFGNYEALVETRSEKEERRAALIRQRSQHEAGAKLYSDVYRDTGDEGSARIADEAQLEITKITLQIKELTREISAMTGSADDATVKRLEKAYKEANKKFLDWNKEGGGKADITKKFDAVWAEAQKRFATEPGIKPGDFLNTLFANIEKDVKGIRPKLLALFQKYFPEFKPPELKADKSLAGDFSIDKKKADKSFAAALVEGTQEAYSVIFGNNSIQDKMLAAAENTAEGIEDLIGEVQKLTGKLTGDGGIPSGALGALK